MDAVAANGIGEVERKAQRSYWEEHSKDLTVEAMMIDSRAADLDNPYGRYYGTARKREDLRK